MGSNNVGNSSQNLIGLGNSLNRDISSLQDSINAANRPKVSGNEYNGIRASYMNLYGTQSDIAEKELLNYFISGLGFRDLLQKYRPNIPLEEVEKEVIEAQYRMIDFLPEDKKEIFKILKSAGVVNDIIISYAKLNEVRKLTNEAFVRDRESCRTQSPERTKELESLNKMLDEALLPIVASKRYDVVWEGYMPYDFKYNASLCSNINKEGIRAPINESKEKAKNSWLKWW